MALTAALAAFGASIALAAPPAQQNDSSEQVSEVVATLATGRVTILSGKDGLVVAAVGTQFEPGSLPPLIVPLASGDIAIVLGADDWIQPPPASRTLLRLDQQLPQLTSGMAGSAPSLTPETNISHLDQLGLAVLEPLRSAAHNLHAQLHLPENLPLAELVLVRQTEDAPLVVDDVSYWIHQTFWQENFWDTEVERPRFSELYPTGQNRSRAVEVSYPPGDNSPGLLAWLSHPSGPFAQALAGDGKLTAAQQAFAGGKLGKLPLDDLVPLVKTALDTMAPPIQVTALAANNLKTGFAWVIQPAASKVIPKRTPGAPSLETPPQLR